MTVKIHQHRNVRKRLIRLIRLETIRFPLKFNRVVKLIDLGTCGIPRFKRKQTGKTQGDSQEDKQVERNSGIEQGDRNSRQRQRENRELGFYSRN